MRVAVMVSLMNLALPLALCLAAQPGEPVNVVPFGQLKTWERRAETMAWSGKTPGTSSV